MQFLLLSKKGSCEIEFLEIGQISLLFTLSPSLIDWKSILNQITQFFFFVFIRKVSCKFFKIKRKILTSLSHSFSFKNTSISYFIYMHCLKPKEIIQSKLMIDYIFVNKFPLSDFFFFFFKKNNSLSEFAKIFSYLIILESNS